MDMTISQWLWWLATAHPLFWSYVMAIGFGMELQRRITRWALGGR